MDVQEIVQKIQERDVPVSPTETNKILDSLRSEAEANLRAVAVGVLMHYEAHALAKALEVTIGGAETTAETASMRFNKMQRQLSEADYAVRKAKADKIMLPSNVSASELAKANQTIRETEHALKAAESNLQTAKKLAVQRHQELDDLRAVHRALMTVKMPDVTPLRVLLDAVKGGG